MRWNHRADPAAMDKRQGMPGWEVSHADRTATMEVRRFEHCNVVPRRNGLTGGRDTPDLSDDSSSAKNRNVFRKRKHSNAPRFGETGGSIMKSAIVSWMMAGIMVFAGACIATGKGNEEFTDSFGLEACSFAPKSDNPYFPLHPGCQWYYEGEEDGEFIQLLITVLADTRTVDGVQTRILEEQEYADGELVEVSRNYFAQCRENCGTFYFGEEVDIYEDGEIVNHEGAWEAGVNGEAGLIMPCLPLLGARYYQEVAPGIALDRAEHVTEEEAGNNFELPDGVEFTDSMVVTPAGSFRDPIIIEETTDLEKNALDYKVYGRGVGLVVDGPLALVWFGCGENFEIDGE